jgi:hypothetical protein
MDGHPTGIQKLGIPLAFERRIGKWRASSHGNHGIYSIRGILFSVTYRF